MPHHCVAFGCSNNGKQEGITFHSFPKNEDLKQKWIDAIKRKDWQPTKWSKLCSAHFREVDIDRTSLSCVRIREGAVPGIFPATSDRQSCEGKPPSETTCEIINSALQGNDHHQQHHGGQKAQQKWRNIRDYYRKYTKKVKNPGLVTLKRFKYVYADQLGFLDPVLEARDSVPESVPSLQEDGMEYVEQALELSLTEDTTENQIASDDPLTPDQPSAATRREINRSTKPDPEAKFLDCDPTPGFSTSGPTPGFSTEDEDKLFLDSLLPTLRSFDTDQKLEFRVEVLRLLQRIRLSKLQTLNGLYAAVQQLPMHSGSPAYFPVLPTLGNFYNQLVVPQMQCQQPHPKKSATSAKQSTPVSQDRVPSPTDTELSAFSEHSN